LANKFEKFNSPELPWSPVLLTHSREFRPRPDFKED